jgi:hypothetical protein
VRNLVRAGVSAIDFASKALELGHARTFTLVDALIERAEARFALGSIAEAESDFALALRAGKRNPKVAAACHLHLARTSAIQGDLAIEDQLNAWKRLKGKSDCFSLLTRKANANCGAPPASWRKLHRGVELGHAESR